MQEFPAEWNKIWKRRYQMKTIRFMFAVLLLVASTVPMFAEGGGMPPNPPKKSPTSLVG